MADALLTPAKSLANMTTPRSLGARRGHDIGDYVSVRQNAIFLAVQVAI